MKSLIKTIAVIFPSLFLFLNCTETPPEIIEDRWILVDQLDTEGKKLAEELVFFLHGKDEEGKEDIQSMQVEHLESNIQWILQGDILKRIDQGGESWFGSFSLVMPMGQVFPHGEYNATLLDKAGSKSEYYWTLVEDHSSEVFLNPPALQMDGNELIIMDREERPWRLLFYDDNTLIYQKYIRSQVKWNVPDNILQSDPAIYLLYIDAYTLRGWKMGPF